MQKFGIRDIGEYVLFGRNTVGENGLALFWSGSGLEFYISAKNLYVTIECLYENMELMLDIILEGERTQKLVLRKGIEKYQVFSGMNPEKKIKVRLVRDTQCMPEEKTSCLIIRDFESDGYFCGAPEYFYNIEFIGDSITSGEGCGLTTRDEWLPVVFDALENYTYKTAIKLNARYRVLSQSGWGLYASWDADTAHVLPDYYDKVCGISSCERCIKVGALDDWVSDPDEMDAVIINLGTNDSTALKTGKFEKDTFIKDFKKKGIDFLKNIRKHNGSCVMVWAYGMLGNDMERYIIDAINDYKKETHDSRVEYLRLPECTGEDLGARFHPTPKGHEKAAAVLADFLQSIQAFMLR